MLQIRKLNINKIINKTARFCYSTNVQNVNDDKYTKEPKYPQILDNSFKSRLYRKRQDMYERLKKLNTVEEKLFALNMPRYYGFKCVMLTDQQFPYNCLPLIQHSTRTVLHKTDQIPVIQNVANQEQVNSFVKTIKSDIEEAIAFEFTGYSPDPNRLFDPEINRKEQAHQRASKLINQINRVILNALSPDNNHLTEVEIDLNPRHEAFWYVGGIEPPVNIRKVRASSFQKDFADDPVNRAFQYIGSPFLAIRHKYPLKSLQVPFSNLSDEVPKYKYDPRSAHFSTDHRHGTTIPGYWPGSSNEFGLISYHSRTHIPFRNRNFGDEDNQEALYAQGILTSYAWLFGQACYQGFSTFNDLTYPLTTQTIITDGQFWSFYVYQLNTTGIHCDVFDSNPYANECWATTDQKLFEEIDENGKLIRFNENVLENLIRFYINKPEERQIDMKPYLGKDEQVIADIEQDDRRAFLEKTYKHLMSNRPRHRLVPEVYSWEKIYKIDNDTKPLAPRRRFFELNVNPFQRRLDEHTPVYIPKVLRPGGPKSRFKWERTFYPKI